MKAEVLGLGCNKCNRLAGVARQAIDAIGLRCSLEKVSDINRMVDLGPDALPALAINDRVVTAGHVPTMSEIKSLLIRSAESVTTVGGGSSSASRCLPTATVGSVRGGKAET